MVLKISDGKLVLVNGKISMTGKPLINHTKKLEISTLKPNKLLENLLDLEKLSLKTLSLILKKLHNQEVIVPFKNHLYQLLTKECVLDLTETSVSIIT